MAAMDVRHDDTGEREAIAAPPGTQPRWRQVASSQRLRRAYDWIRKPYDELPPAPAGIGARLALGLVAVMAIAFVVFFTAYLWGQQDAYLTHAEDLGIMDQALWNTVHGAPLHQTICNIVGDTNCLGDISRLAIHFEPIMFPISLLYLVVPSPKTLQLLQALVVASGAFPAYWIASRRLRSALAGVAFAALYLIYPALQAAVTYDFHAVTLSAAFLMFALYFMLSRNTVGLFTACLLALLTKEEMPVDIAMIGLCIAAFQRRWRVGGALIAISVIWLGIALAVMHAASPLGHSPTASRYAYLGASPVQAAVYVLTHPVQVIRGHVLDGDGVFYLRSLFSPAAYLPFLSPLTLIIAVPAIGINILSTDPTMRSGLYHYNAEIVPVLVFSAIQGVAYLSEAAGWVAEKGLPVIRAGIGAAWAWTRRIQARHATRVALATLVVLVLFFGLHEQRDRGYLPFARGFAWPQQTAHAELANSFLPLIPPEASVSAQSDLVPHVSHRRYIYMYPYRAAQSDYVFLDVTGNLYPYGTQPQQYFATVSALLASGQFHVVAARDGYLLLKRGAAPPVSATNPFGLPDAFFGFTKLPASYAVPNTTDVGFGPSLRLVGYAIEPASRLTVGTFITITMYWKATGPVTSNLAPQLLFTRQDGTHFSDGDFASADWLPMRDWQPGATYAVRSWPIFLGGAEAGQLRMDLRVLDTSAPGGATAVAVTQSTAGGAPLPVVNGTDVTLLNQPVSE